MSIQDLGSIGEFIGSMLILVTLVYLAIQSKYQQKLLVSQAYQARTDTIIGMLESTATNSSVAARTVKLRNGEELTEMELLQHGAGVMAMLRSIENGHFQYSIGVLSAEYGNTLKAMVRSVLEREQSRAVWTNSRVYFRDSFAGFVDSIVEEIEQEEAAA
jgi:hypothetical protein